MTGRAEWIDGTLQLSILLTARYCQSCIEKSVSPSNPKPPRHPMATTLKRQRKPKRESSAAGGSPSAKRARQDSPKAANGHTAVNGGTNGTSTLVEGRPKRQAALDRPDYLNMHNHVPTPTKQWVDLIKDPAKYGRVIKEGKLHSVCSNSRYIP